MNCGVGAPLLRPCLMRAFVKTISVSLTVMSSSFEAPSCATDGRIQTGGTDIYCHMNSSGLPHSGCRPSSSQSYKTQLSDLIGLNAGAHLVRNLFEQVQHLQGIQILMQRLVDVHPELLLRFHGRSKAPFPLLHLVCCFLCPEFVVNDFQYASSFHGAVRR